MKLLLIRNLSATYQLLALLAWVSGFTGAAFADEPTMANLPQGTTVQVIKPIRIVAGMNQASINSSKCSISVNAQQVDRVIPAGEVFRLVEAVEKDQEVGQSISLVSSDEKKLTLRCLGQIHRQTYWLGGLGFSSNEHMVLPSLEEVKYETSDYLSFTIPGPQPF